MTKDVLLKTNGVEILFKSALDWKINCITNLFSCKGDLTVRDFIKDNPIPPFLYYFEGQLIDRFIFDYALVVVCISEEANYSPASISLKKVNSSMSISIQELSNAFLNMC